jgi:hypothetical protein
MKASKALQIVADFKGQNLKQNLNVLRADLIGKGKNQISQPLRLYEAALEVKRISAQIDEMLHASGIIKCLPVILDNEEIIESLSLASGADGEGIDLVTNLRIAEFKFSKWQVGKANGMRKRQVFGDLVQLYLNPTKKKKELYVLSYDMVLKFVQSKKAMNKNVLSKSGGLDKRLEAHLLKNDIDATYLNDIYSTSNVKIIDIETILKK